MDNDVKQENLQSSTPPPAGFPGEETVTLVDLCSSDDSDLEQDVERRYNSGNPVGAKRPRDTSGGSSSALDMNNVKKQTVDELKVVLPEGLGQSIPPPHDVTHTFPADPCNVFTSMQPPSPPPPQPQPSSGGRVGSCKQFWKAGDYEGAPGGGNWDLSSGGFDHVRVHPKFLHSNATSHKWALGAFAELLDNALDEVASGATYVNVDMLENKKEGNRMLLIEDNGGGMDPEKMRQCMSLGYSAKSKLANTIGQYGNGFKTSTMRLGADVIVFSRCPGKDGKSSTQSIGLLSYTFLRSTGKEDIVVPMLDYERRDTEWSKIGRSSVSDWDKNVKTIIQWSPFSSEEDLLRQFALMNEHGTRIIIYNLWEDDQGMLELDFDADPHDIQLRGVNRDEKNIKMAAQFPNSRHFLTYKHSLRSYASILYLRIPPTFRVILRGSDVEHHNVVNDMMQTEQITYRPQYGADSYVTDSNMSAVVILGFVKDAKHHVDVQGFNVYHKNRLIKPFWRIWNATGSDGRGVIGVLEANFVEPAHDKQGFERTTVLSRLETRLVQMQKIYWNTNCHKIGYAPRRHKNAGNEYGRRDTSPENDPEGYAPSGNKTRASDKFYSSSYPNHRGDNGVPGKDSSLYLQEELRRERERSKALEAEVELARQKIEEMSKEQENLIEIFTEERDRRDVEEESLRNKLEEASNTIEELLNKIKMLEGSKGPSWRR
ncbi:hypothetical protein Bca52824_093733 [Brassica carinata]|uniref:Morc S5 domain-containing protein n=1 Tax=Brassica carinata TaxID=52824 RepID=A0A8X7P5M2_BRACI|nr:hypothetical protein Bca52824_093733 [Brassica carinata]